MAAVPPHLYSYPLYVYRMLAQVFIVDLPTLLDGTGVHRDLRELHRYYMGVHQEVRVYPAEWLRALPSRVRDQIAECFHQVADTHLIDVVRQYGLVQGYALGIARRAAWQGVREQSGARPLHPDTTDAHLARLAPRHAALAAACAARSTQALSDAVGDAATAGGLALGGAPTEAQWQWLGTLAALLAPGADRVAPDDVSPAALCMRAADDVVRGMRAAFEDARRRVREGAPSEGGPPVAL